eukprot:6195298-Pleurochrysis_carterae.AAC.2
MTRGEKRSVAAPPRPGSEIGAADADTAAPSQHVARQPLHRVDEQREQREAVAARLQLEHAHGSGEAPTLLQQRAAERAQR